MSYVVDIPDNMIFCECRNFIHDLINMGIQIFEIQNEKTQWKTFVNHMHQYLRKKRRNFDDYVKPCTFYIFSTILNRLRDFEKSEMTAATLILEMISTINFKNSNNIRSCFVWNIQRTIPISSDGETLRVLGAMRGKMDLMQLFVNYGFVNSLRKDCPRLHTETSKVLFNFIYDIGGHNGSYVFRFSKMMDFFKRCFFPAQEDDEINKRVFFIGTALWAVRHKIRKEHDIAEKIINCLLMYFSATRDPLLTIFEVRSIVYAFSHLLNNDGIFDRYADEFHLFMPECPATLQPRKLTHLARFQVRENLERSKLPLPYTIEKLQLPKSVKDFLLCNKFDFRSKNGNASSHNAVTKSELAEMIGQRTMF